MTRKAYMMMRAFLVGRRQESRIGVRAGKGQDENAEATQATVPVSRYLLILQRY